VNVYLIGMPGSGKSEVGALLAPMLEMSFVDLDALIEQEAGMPVADVFRTEGELGFRRREREALRSAAQREDLVVACGGGTVVDGENRELMRASGRVVLLEVDPDTIAGRIEFDGSRPLLREPADIERLLEERAHDYRTAADAVVDGSETPETVAAQAAEAVGA
jgi:shikimate kinase